MQSKLDAEGDCAQKKHKAGVLWEIPLFKPDDEDSRRSQLLGIETATCCIGNILPSSSRKNSTLLTRRVDVVFHCLTDEEFASKLAKNNFRYACIGRTMYDVRGSQISIPDCSGFEVVMTAPLRSGEIRHDTQGFLPPELGIDQVELERGKEQIGETQAASDNRKDATLSKQRYSSPPPPSERDRQQFELQGIVSRFLRSATKLSSKMYSNGQRMINTIGGLFGGFK